MRVLRRLVRLMGAMLAAALCLVPMVAFAVPGSRVSGSGSSWAGNALNQWVGDIKAQGLTVDYNPNGSSTGRKEFVNGLNDFAVSEIPFTGRTADPSDGGLKPGFSFGMMPAVAGGTAFMYNLPVGGQAFGDLKLSQDAIAKIFTGQVTMWNDPVIKKSNPGVALPANRITVVVRADGSGSSAQFTQYLSQRHQADYAALCKVAHCNPATPTSYFPSQGMTNFVGQAGSIGVTNYVATTPYSINYDEYSYALNSNLPVVQLQNAAGYFVQPTAPAVAVALTQASINTNASSPEYLTQDLGNVYPYRDPRAYPLSAYSYVIAPRATHDNLDAGKGASLAYFLNYALCGGQQSMGALGYSPLPMNLVLAAQQQVLKVPGIDKATVDAIKATQQSVTLGTGNPCNNPTFKPGDSPSVNQLVRTAPFPTGCDAACQNPWTGAAASENKGPSVQGATKHVSAAKPSTKTPAGTTRTTGTSGSTTTTAPRTGATARAGAPGQPAGGTAPQGSVDQAGSVAAGMQPAGAVQTVLPGESGWGTTQNLLLMAGLGLAGLVCMPAAFLQLVRRRDGGSR